MTCNNKLIKLCSINIWSLSDRSQFTLDNYAYSEKFDAVFVQETETTDSDKLKLTNIKVVVASAGWACWVVPHNF